MENYKGTEYDHTILVNSIRGWLKRASLWETLQGVEWYWNAHKFARLLSEKTNKTLYQTSAVISILSPATRWNINMRDTETMLVAARNGDEMPPVTTYPWQQQKAWKVATLPEEEVERMGLDEFLPLISKPDYKKTRSFYYNIADPTLKEWTTVDRWILRGLGLKCSSLTPKRYDAITEAFVAVAGLYNVQAWKIQAIMWLTVKNCWSPQDTENDLLIKAKM